MKRLSVQLLLIMVFGLLSACETTPKLEEDIAPVEERSYRPPSATVSTATTTETPLEGRGAESEVNVYTEEAPEMPPLEPLQLAKAEPVEPSVSSATQKQVYKTGPAAQGLLDQAGSLAQNGKPDQAAAMIERALRIEPSNPWLWHRYSVLRLQQKLYKQSIDLARKSISLASGDKRLQAGNWQVIARASDSLGDSHSASDAREKVRQLGGG